MKHEETFPTPQKKGNGKYTNSSLDALHVFWKFIKHAIVKGFLALNLVKTYIPKISLPKYC